MFPHIKTNKTVFIVCIALFFATLLPSQTNALTLTSDKTIDEGEGFMVINHEDGTQKMAIAITPKPHAQDIFWITPIPAATKDITAEPAQSFPAEIAGREVHTAGHRNLREISSLWLSTQIYPLPFILARDTEYGSDKTTGMPALVSNYDYTQESDDNESELTALDNLSDEGMVTNIIASGDLKTYLRDKNIAIPDNWTDRLATILETNASFVVTDLPASDDYTSRAILITFPTDSPTLPLNLTETPTTVRLFGLLSPDDETLHPHYYDNANIYISPYYEDMFSKDKTAYYTYTKLYVSRPDNNISFRDQAPIQITFIRLLRDGKPWIIYIGWPLLSIFASWLAAIITWKHVRASKRQQSNFALWGLWNMLSLLGLGIATVFLRTRKLNKEQSELADKLRQHGLKTDILRRSDARKWIYLALFTGLFVAISYALPTLISLTI